MAHSVEADEIANPVPVGFLGAHAVVANANGIAKLVAQFWLPAAIRAHGYFSELPI